MGSPDTVVGAVGASPAVDAPGPDASPGRDQAVDPRVAAVLEVLADGVLVDVARRWAVDVALLERWVRGFVEAGTAAVTNRPEVQVAQQRDRFLAAFAHELRSPLTVAQGWAGMLLDGDLDARTAQSSVQRLHEALGRLADRTADVELLAAASLGRVQVRRERVSVGRLVAGLPAALPVESADADLLLDVDPRLLRLVLRDLWLAAGLAPAPRSVRLEVCHVGPWAELRVVREGDPIAPQVLSALFEPFDLNDDATGVTVGLYLARALTVAHGGTIGIEQDDHRAALWVRVPADPPPQHLPT